MIFLNFYLFVCSLLLGIRDSVALPAETQEASKYHETRELDQRSQGTIFLPEMPFLAIPISGKSNLNGWSMRTIPSSLVYFVCDRISNGLGVLSDW